MFSKMALFALASAVIIPAVAVGHPGGGGGGPPGGGGGMGNSGGMDNSGGMSGFGNGNSGGMGDMGSNMREQSRMNSQGPTHASAMGIAHADQNSVLAGTFPTNAVTRGSLAGLTTGATLYSNGASVGTVQQIRTTGNGGVAMVVVKGKNGGLYAVPAAKLTFTGGNLSTNLRLAGINTSADVANNNQGRLNSQGPAHASATGVAHANQHSVLYNAATAATLTGVSVGMPLVSNGTQVGTVYRVVTGNGVITRVLVQGTNGRIYSLAPNTLNASGGSLTTSAVLRGI